VPSVVSIRPESPPIEIIRLPHPVNSLSQLTVHEPDGSSSILTVKPISLIPLKTVSKKDEATRKLAWPKKKQMLKL
jgi:hypothetical protein